MRTPLLLLAFALMGPPLGAQIVGGSCERGACHLVLAPPHVDENARGADWDPAPWLGDLAAMRQAIDTKYANLDWLRDERQVDIDQLRVRAEQAVKHAGDDAGARRVFDRFVQRLGDGHVSLRWPASVAGSPMAATAPTPASFCAAQGFDAGRASAGTAVSLPGYRALADAPLLPAGLVEAGGARIGVIRIGEFGPQFAPPLCVASVVRHRIPIDRPCDDDCDDHLQTDGYRTLTDELAATIERLRREGATVLMIDLTGNGGGSEWAEAAARMVSDAPLRSEAAGFVRGPHWADYWRDLGKRLRGYAAKGGRADRAALLGWAAEADAALALAEAPCAPGCARVTRAGFATGLVGSAKAGQFAGKAWAPYVFSPAQFGYRDGVWSGPLIVLVDNETWSAAEEFAAVLQDNRAAIVFGARTGGAGCGHTRGGTPTTLPNSRAVLELPDCVRFRADGSNEVGGVVPDVLAGIRANDGAAYAARLVALGLPNAVAAARLLYAARR